MLGPGSKGGASALLAGLRVEILARGTDIEVAWLDGARMVAAGNSFATAYVTGICTLILAKHPGLTPFQLKTVLRETAANPEGV